MPEAYKVLMAKSDPEDSTLWLPLWMHLKDTAGVMKELVHSWVPMSVVQATGLDFQKFEKTAVFLAAVHDIGKATSYFQSIITVRSEKRNELKDAGYEISRPDSFKRETPHSFAGQWILQSKVTGIGVNRSVADVVGAHHGEPIDCRKGNKDDLIQTYQRNFFGSSGDPQTETLWKDSWRKIVDNALKDARLQSVQDLPVLNIEAQVLLSGLLIVADWIASNTTYFPLISIDDRGCGDLYPERVKSGYGMLNFPQGWSSNTFSIDDEDFRYRFGFYPNPVQKEMIQAVESCENPGIFILEAQMGVGKTEAALSAAELLANHYETGGIFFGLPTQATSNGIFGRLKSWAGSVSEETVSAISLAHGAAELNDEFAEMTVKGKSLVDNVDSEDGGVSVHPWFQGTKKALLANFVIGTVDQFLMATLRRRHFMLRHLGLAGKVVIIDECHAYDTYMNEYLDRTLTWMAAYGIPVILLSATLPSKRRSELINCYAGAYFRYHLGKGRWIAPEADAEWEDNRAYPLLTWTDGENICQKKIEWDGASKNVMLSTIGSVDDMISLLNDALKEGGCACIILNTVKDAQNVFKEVCSSMEDATVLLYHAQFTMPDRSRKEQELLKHMGKGSSEEDRKRYVLIGTQVLEQSLDYDADIMISQLCPADLLLQRMGRLHRHQRFRPESLQIPRFYVLTEGNEPFGEGTKAVYGAYLLIRTWQEIQGKESVSLPDDIPTLVQSVYCEAEDVAESEAMADARREYEETQADKRVRADGYLLKEPDGTIERSLVSANLDEEKVAECQVRDGASALEVLLMKKDASGAVTFVGDNEGDLKLDPNKSPDDAVGRSIARQRIRLPHVFSQAWNVDETIKKLEDRNREELASWQESPWIKGELILLLDEKNCTELNGYKISYSRELGLQYEKKEEKDGG